MPRLEVEGPCEVPVGGPQSAADQVGLLLIETKRAGSVKANSSTMRGWMKIEKAKSSMW